MLKPYLQTFITVCEMGSLTKAASALFITPSAVNQQMNSLENHLGVSLFVRSPKGISLTPAGEYLFVHGKDLLHRNNEICREVKAVSSESNEICVGTSLMEKCRLLYDLWVLFAEKEKDFSIKMVNIDSGHTIPSRTDLVESVNGEVPWTKNWEFMEICQVPFGFAFSMDHPLAKKKILTLDDLGEETVVSINKGSSERILCMLNTLRDAGINLLIREAADSSTIWECAFHHYVLVAPLCWEDILINMHMRPCRWDHSIPYGIFYRHDPSPAVMRFLDFIRLVYAEQDPRETVWTL